MQLKKSGNGWVTFADLSITEVWGMILVLIGKKQDTFVRNV